MAESPRNVIWIASYPKSGNTWVRFLACNLMFGRQESAQALNALAPDLHEQGDVLAEGTHAGFVKTHFPYSERLPLADRTAGAFYVVRHPADVLASNFHYARRSSSATEDSQGTFDRYFDTYLELRGDPRWFELGMGSWEDNVRSWLGAPLGFPVAPIRYEDLSADPLRVGTLMADLMRPGCPPGDIAAAVENSSFARMREIEDTDIRERRVGIFYKPYLQPSIDAGRRFMRGGNVGEGLRMLTRDQRTRFAAAFGPLCGELGYSID